MALSWGSLSQILLPLDGGLIRFFCPASEKSAESASHQPGAGRRLCHNRLQACPPLLILKQPPYSPVNRKPGDAIDLEMATSKDTLFDQYHKWLGIPKDQRPPTHYQLLGLSPTEQDREVIEEAAIRQTTHLRAYQMGPHAADCTRILNEVAQARQVLLDPAKRRAYDQTLASKSAARA